MRCAWVLAILCLAALAVAGCTAMLYPMALAYGGATESELKRSREAFVELRGTIAMAPLFVAQTGVIRDWEPAFEAEPARMALARVREAVSPGAELEREVPVVPEIAHGKNQLRYANQRGRAYAAWVASKKAPSGLWLFTEILANREGTEVYGGYAWIVDAAGRIAYERHFNSHTFGKPSLPGIGPFLDLVVQVFVSDLERDPMELFPKYGVG